MKNIIVGIITVCIVGLMVYTASQGKAFQGGESAKVVGNIGVEQGQNLQQSDIAHKDERDIEAEKLKALRDKAGNVAAFKVSDNYKKRCASCHGIDGKGAVGLPLYGQSADILYGKINEFKEGKRTNPIMRSAIMHLSDEELKELAQEVSEFKAREAATN